MCSIFLVVFELCNYPHFIAMKGGYNPQLEYYLPLQTSVGIRGNDEIEQFMAMDLKHSFLTYFMFQPNRITYMYITLHRSMEDTPLQAPQWMTKPCSNSILQEMWQ